jgi:hypothetical protein
MISTALTISTILASSMLAVSYGLERLWLPAIAILTLGGVWLLAQRAKWGWMAWPMLALLALAAAVGASLDLNAVLMLGGLTASLSAWDLDGFIRQLESVDIVEQELFLHRRHLRRLLVVDLLGLLPGALALAVEIELSFPLALVLGLVALIALSRAIGLFRREGG